MIKKKKAKIKNKFKDKRILRFGFSPSVTSLKLNMVSINIFHLWWLTWFLLIFLLFY